MRSLLSDQPPAPPGEHSRSGERPLLVAGHLDAWWCWTALGLAVIFGVVAATAALLRHPLRFGLTAVAILAAVVGIVGLILQFWRRQWFSWTDDSVRLQGRGWLLEVLDSDLESLAVTRDYRHAVGRIVAVAHGLSLWPRGGERRLLALEARSPLGEPAPFEHLVARVQHRLERKALDALRRNGAIKRADWSWDSGQLVAQSQGRRINVAIGDITAVDNDDAELRVWVGSDPLPVLKISQASQDVWLLGRMLAGATGAPGDADVAPATGLGRILHESRPRSAAILATLLCGLSAAIAFVAVAGAVAFRLTPLAILGAGTGVGSIMLGSTAKRLWKCAFRLHEAGISQRSLTGDRSLKFEEIDQFVFDARRQYSKGRYLGTLFTMVFASESQPRQGILHSERNAYETDEIASIRDRVAEEIAAGMVTKLAATGELKWTRELTIRGGVLQCEPRRFLRKNGRPIAIDITAIRSYDISEGWLYVWSAERTRPLFKVRTAEPNFYPGLLIFEQLLERTTVNSSQLPVRS